MIPSPLKTGVEQAIGSLAEPMADLDEASRAQAPRVFAASVFVRNWCLKHPQQIAAMLAGDLPELVVDADQSAFDSSLRRRRNQAMVRLAWNECAAVVSAQQTVTELSQLADECLQSAYDWHRQAMQKRHGLARDREGKPVGFSIIALGKLGGRELNFSSDVDVIFAYGSSGSSDGEKPLDNAAYFVRLGQRIIASMADLTAEGFVFRVDLRLRPFGEKSPISHSHGSLEQYYEAHGREWERYAWVKARACAGDLAVGKQLIASLRPFVYRRYLDYGAIAAMRDMKAQIDEQVRKRGHEQNIKLGWGGIREVEFVVQVFQLVRGGSEPALQSNSLMAAMDAIERLGLHDAGQMESLRDAYWFLRRVENCWQAQRDQQSHVLPENEEPRMALAAALGLASWAELDMRLQHQRAIVHAQFAALFAHSDEEQCNEAWLNWWKDGGDDVPLPEHLQAYEKTALDLRHRVERRLQREEDQQVFAELLGVLLPSLDAGVTADRVLAVLEVLVGRSNYVALLRNNAVARRELMLLCAASDFLAREIRQFPAVLSELLDPVRLYAPDDRKTLHARLKEHLEGLPETDVEARMDVIRRTRHATTLRIAAADVSAALPIMHVSDRLSELAEEILQSALEQAVLQMRQRYPDLAEPNFAVIAYGKLGGLELSYTSDLDLVFVYDKSERDLPLDAQVFYTRLAQKMIHFLATPTGAGTAYEIDTRLRPSGQSGLLVTSLQGLADYQHNKAWTWEHQALIRARAVAGSEPLRNRFDDLRAEVLAKLRPQDELLTEVQDMREKMRAELAPKDGSFHPKQSPGGLVDIEFLTQYAVLAHAFDRPQVRWFTDVVRILEQLTQHGLLSAELADGLSRSYRQLRAVTHQHFLSGKPVLELMEGVEPQLIAEQVRAAQAELSS